MSDERRFAFAESESPGAGLAIEARGLTVKFGQRRILDSLSFGVRSGEVVGLVGGSGSGKTTLMRSLIGLQSLDGGEVRLFGEPFAAGGRAQRAARLSRVGVLFQHGALFSALSVFDNIAFPLREMGGLDRGTIHDLVMTRLAMVELRPQDAWLLPSQLSGGMTKRVALARALALDPEVLLLDEPTAGLDPERSDVFVELIRALSAELDLTVVLVTHDIETLVELAERVAVLAQGQVVADGPLAEVKQHPHPFVQRFMGCERSRRALAELGQGGR